MSEEKGSSTSINSISSTISERSERSSEDGSNLDFPKSVLERKLSLRPSKEDLKLRNILRNEEENENKNEKSETESSNESGVVTQNINFEKTSKQLKSILKKRPERSVLEDMNILIGRSMDPSIVATQQNLKRAQLLNAMENLMRDRPTINDASVQKVIHFNESVEVLPTFRKSEYSRRPDINSTFKHLTPQLKMQIREELNEYKKHEMQVHESSLRNTLFH
ncbi:hypothetical protein BCR32DRAFT_226831 [Anaeromyces robustus]|uniref:RPEL repeat protein n=1 Tax=Anaeromyces robustus TaxID=1754192 RepID=A0A1Y1VS35_9FUNG|nr:hypothetical protein BCR32DRAFT_226831 [Anaeromyces robustus]|eukprot:ORX63983.1 hypothetical protein BCR32DRAFT_226831 [Anaeromyces robustus]